LAAPEREREAIQKTAFNENTVQLSGGMSLIETNMKMKKDAGASGDAAGISPADEAVGEGREKAIVGLADESGDEEQVLALLKPVKGCGEWKPRLRKTEAVGVSGAEPGRKFQWPH